MKRLSLFAAACLFASAAVHAADTAAADKAQAPAASQPAAEAQSPSVEKAKPAPKAEEPAPAKAEEKAAAAPAEAAPAKEPAPKPLGACAAKLSPVTDAYQKAHDDFQAWLRSSSEKMAAVDERVAKLKAKIAQDEAELTNLRLNSPQVSAARISQLDAETRNLWSQLRTEQSRQGRICRALAAAAADQVRRLNRSVTDALQKSASRMR